MHWCCLLAQNAPLQALLLLNAAPSASFPTSSSTGSTRLGHSLIQSRRGAALSRRGWAHIDGCRRGICTADTLMLASCRVFGRHTRYSSLGQALKARKAREMQLTAVLGPLLLAILGVFADARSARMAAAEATRSSDGRLGDRVSRL